MNPNSNERWDVIQEKMMNLVSAQVTSQNEIADVNLELEKLKETVEEVEEYLRGSKNTQHNSFETRLTLVERGVAQSAEYERAAARRFRSIETILGEIRGDLQTITIHHTMAEKSETTKSERVKEWFKLWGGVIAIIGTITVTAIENWDKIATAFKKDTRPPIVQKEEEIKAERKKRGGAKKIKKEMEERYGPNIDNE